MQSNQFQKFDDNDLVCYRVRVANELGAGSARRAKFAIVNVVTTSFSIGVVLFVFFLLFRGKLSYIFTTSEEVAAAVADLSPLLAFSILLNSVQPVLSGLLQHLTELQSFEGLLFSEATQNILPLCY
jgi:Na+-driven multidrug efflux pump